MKRLSVFYATKCLGLTILCLLVFLSTSLFAQGKFRELEKQNVIRLMDRGELYKISADATSKMNMYDVNSYQLDLNIENNSTEISGNTTIIVTILEEPLDTLVFELIDTLVANTQYMVVDSVFINNTKNSFIHKDHLVKIGLSDIPDVGSKLETQVFYHGDGQRTEESDWDGIQSDQSAYGLGDSLSYTYQQPFGARIWFPCKQILIDKADSISFAITTNANNKAGTNGILVSTTELPNNKVRYQWKSFYPTAYYLISFCVGPYTEYTAYAKLPEKDDSVFIQSYLMADSPYLGVQLASIEQTTSMIEIFSTLYGDYPFKDEKYGYCVTPWKWGAMENQTMTTIGYIAMDTAITYIGDWMVSYYTAHELAHSWFGDNVTCATWQDIWVNEGFATYGEYLILERIHSEEVAVSWLSNLEESILSEKAGSIYVPDEDKENADRIFDSRLSYDKGAFIIHTLRFEIANDSVFFDVLKEFQVEFKDSVATGLDFKDVLEDITGRDFTYFFDQWYFGEGYPTFKITYSQVSDTLFLNSKQTTSATTGLFKMPFELKLEHALGDTTIRLEQTQQEELFKIYFPYELSDISFDPKNWVLAKASFSLTDVDEEEEVITDYRLQQNFPNPFNPATTIRFSLPYSSNVRLEVFNTLGEKVAVLLDEKLEIGSYQKEFNAKDLASGIYVFKLTAKQVDGNKEFVEAKKMLLLK